MCCVSREVWYHSGSLPTPSPPKWQGAMNEMVLTLSRLRAMGVASDRTGTGSGAAGGSAAAKGALAVTRLETRMLPALVKLLLVLMERCVL